MANRPTKISEHRAEILALMERGHPAFGTVNGAQGSRWWAAATSARDAGKCALQKVDPTGGGDKWVCVPPGHRFDIASFTCAPA